jgi:hypothetical protein
MNEVLNQELMLVLFKVQPKRDRVPADYMASGPEAAYCGGNTCTKVCGNNCVGRCPGSCLGSCTRSCQGKAR